jgi:hypothetical protein
MTQKAILLIGLIVLLTSTITQNKQSVNKTFTLGEELKYRLHYSIFTAGEATIQVKPTLKKSNGKICYNLNIEGQSTGAFSSIISIKDHWQSLVDTSTLFPTQSFREIKEAKYYLKENVEFKDSKALVTTSKKDNIKKQKSHEVPKDVFDIVSGYYYLRNLDYKSLRINETISIDAFFENKLYNFSIRYKGVETIKTKFGKIKAYKIVPIMPGNKLFDGEDSIAMWLSADKNQIPLKVRAKMFVGAVEIELKSHAGLRHDLKFKK